MHGLRSLVFFSSTASEKDRKFANPNIIKVWDGEVALVQVGVLLLLGTAKVQPGIVHNETFD